MISFPLDVPSPINLQGEADAREWASKAMVSRPWRVDFFECIRANLKPSSGIVRVLELGSGPGFLAEHILSRSPNVHIVLLDFSEPMHAMAKERLAPYLGRASFLLRSFKDDDWNVDLSCFDHVVTNQAVHEVRHKRHTATLHAAVRRCLSPGGTYLMSDHYAGDDGMKNSELYPSVEEHRIALQDAGFGHIRELRRQNGMVLYCAS